MKNRFVRLLGVAILLAVTSGCSSKDSGLPAETDGIWDTGESDTDGGAKEDGEDSTQDITGAEELPVDLPVAPAECLPTTPFDPAGVDLSYLPLRGDNPLEDANLYFLTILDKEPEAAVAIAGSEILQQIAAQRVQVARDAAEECAGDADCLQTALLWESADILAVSEALEGLFCGNNAQFDLVSAHLRPSGVFQLFADLDDCALLAKAWNDAANTLNHIWTKYASKVPAEELEQLINESLTEEAMPFYRPLLNIGVGGMDQLGRDEAARYEPLSEGENKIATDRMKTIEWDRYPYSLIVVLGFGPLNETDAISIPGIEHTASAADRYHEGLAPFVVFSGGHVQPDQTPFCEALEMKKVAMEDYGIPEEAILLEPYARHTTTNLRNASRFVIRHQIPPDRPILIITDLFQTGVINYSLADRCLEDLGFVPFRKVHQLADTDTCMLVEPTSLYRDSSDLLDP